MLGFGAGADAKAVLEAMSKSQAIIEFKLDGSIIFANENFCRALGYQGPCLLLTVRLYAGQWGSG
jgi:methyl-accepting chemotaxis protein